MDYESGKQLVRYRRPPGSLTASSSAPYTTFIRSPRSTTSVGSHRSRASSHTRNPTRSRAPSEDRRHRSSTGGGSYSAEGHGVPQMTTTTTTTTTTTHGSQKEHADATHASIHLAMALLALESSLRPPAHGARRPAAVQADRQDRFDRPVTPDDSISCVSRQSSHMTDDSRRSPKLLKAPGSTHSKRSRYYEGSIGEAPEYGDFDACPYEPSVGGRSARSSQYSRYA